MATFTFSKPIVFDGTTYSKVEIPDELEVGHQDFYFEHRDQYTKERLGIRLCAMICDMPIEAFKKVKQTDFAKISKMISKLFPDEPNQSQKKVLRQPKE